MASNPRHDRFHGRVHGAAKPCAHPGCGEPGEFRAPDPDGPAATPNGPGRYRYLCLDHVRAFNAGYNWFDGMSAEEIMEAQSPLNVWPSETRAFRPGGGVDLPPRWADFKDPLDALKTLGLGEDADRRALRSAYSAKVRAYHPDKNGGNRAYEKALQDVIAAYTHLKSAPAFA
jgi:hypothetical protein